MTDTLKADLELAINALLGEANLFDHAAEVVGARPSIPSICAQQRREAAARLREALPRFVALDQTEYLLKILLLDCIEPFNDPALGKGLRCRHCDRIETGAPTPLIHDPDCIVRGILKLLESRSPDGEGPQRAREPRVTASHAPLPSLMTPTPDRKAGRT